MFDRIPVGTKIIIAVMVTFIGTIIAVKPNSMPDNNILIPDSTKTQQVEPQQTTKEQVKKQSDKLDKLIEQLKNDTTSNKQITK